MDAPRQYQQLPASANFAASATIRYASRDIFLTAAISNGVIPNPANSGEEFVLSSCNAL
jgi:hypothetical protein